MVKPAELLDKHLLPNNWVVVGRAPTPTDGTGSAFSVGYIVESADTGQRAFLKALDLTTVLGPDVDILQAIEAAGRAFNFERDLLDRCRGRRMNHVVSIIDYNQVTVDATSPIGTVPYLIFEQADGDVRAYLDFTASFDIAWMLGCMHHIAKGITELHTADIAHQDLKPSNVLVFNGASSKVGDLGRAALRTVDGPYDADEFAGSRVYAPPELLYGQLSGDWTERRFGCDAYLVGSMLVFFFTRTSMTGLLFLYLDPSFRPWRAGGSWQGDFSTVLPHLLAAFDNALSAFSKEVPAAFRDELTTLVRQLCMPDPKRRGHPKNRTPYGNPFSLERYISRFNALQREAEGYMLRSRK